LLIGVLGLLALVAAPFVLIYAHFRRVYGDPALVAAASNGDARTVRALLNRGAPANSYHIEGSSALWWAVASGSLETVQLLLDHGADSNSRGQFDSVIDQAIQNLDLGDGKPRRAIAEALLARAAQIRDPEQVKALREALAQKPPAKR
jgi:ankyrin repeat protein